MYFKFLFVLCVACLLLTSALSKPLADGSAEVISDEDMAGVPLTRGRRTVTVHGGCSAGQKKVLGNCNNQDSDYD